MSKSPIESTGTPGVYRREDGRLVVRVTVAHPTRMSRPGVAAMVERSRLLPAGTTMREARREAEILRGQARSSEAAHPPAVPTLASYAAIWLARKTALGDWREGSTTASVMAASIANRIAPTLGALPVDRITHGELQRWLDAALVAYGKSTVRLTWFTLRALVVAACLDYGLPDPTPKIRPPRDRRATHAPDLVVMGDGDFAELHRTIAVVERERPEWLALVLLGYATGARPGELLTAEVRDLDLSQPVGRWSISRHLGLGRTVVAGTKTTEAPRVSYIDPSTTTRLRELLAGKFPLARIAPSRAEEQRPAWPGSRKLSPDHHRGDRPANRTDLRTFFAWLSARVDRELTPKTFRQTHITAALVMGVPSKMVREQTGHSSQQIQERYVRVHAPERAAVAEQMGAMFAPDMGPNLGTVTALDEKPK